MIWSDLDKLVVAVLIVQTVGVIGVAIAVRMLLGGVKRSTRRVGVVVKAGVGLAETGRAQAAALTAGAQAVAVRARALKDAARFPDPPEGFLITPQSLRSGATMALTARRLLEVARTRKLAAKRPRGRSIADRLGLVPPLFKRLGWLRTVGSVGWSVVKELRGGR